MRRIPEVSSLTKLDRRANLMRGLSGSAWEELPNGVLRADRRSPQFRLARFLDDLVALAVREGFCPSFDGPWVEVWSGGYRQGWKQIRRWVVFTPKEGVPNA